MGIGPLAGQLPCTLQQAQMTANARLSSIGCFPNFFTGLKRLLFFLIFCSILGIELKRITQDWGIILARFCSFCWTIEQKKQQVARVSCQDLFTICLSPKASSVEFPLDLLVSFPNFLFLNNNLLYIEARKFLTTV